jgi:hypothetical protein
MQGQQGLQGLQGPQGPPGTNGTNGTNGQAGPQGQQGQTGPAGPTNAYYGEGQTGLTTTATPVVTMNQLSAGMYLMWATVRLVNTGAPSDVSCAFDAPPPTGTAAQAETQLADGTSSQTVGTISLNDSTNLTGTSISVNCTSTTATGVTAGPVTIDAIAVTNLTQGVHRRCLTRDTLIATPHGLIRADQVRAGTVVWSADRTGHRIRSTVLDVLRTPVAPTHEMLRLTLADGRVVQTDPDQPTPDGSLVSSLLVGQPFEGSFVVSARRVRYGGGFTVELLPSGPTQTYFANGVWLRSGLADPKG